MALEGSRVPAWVERSPEWRAAWYLLEAPALREKDVLRFVDFESRRINVLALLDRARSWSAGEELLIKAACALFNSTGLPSRIWVSWYAGSTTATWSGSSRPCGSSARFRTPSPADVAAARGPGCRERAV